MAVTQEFDGKTKSSLYIIHRKLLLNTSNYLEVPGIEINKFHNRFGPQKMVVELFYFACERPNLQLDPPRL